MNISSNKIQKCDKCKQLMMNEYGKIFLCDCDNKEVNNSISKIRKVKVSKSGYASSDIFKENKNN